MGRSEKTGMLHEYSNLFHPSVQKYLRPYSYAVLGKKRNKNVLLLINMISDDNISETNKRKPETIQFHNKNKVALEMMDSMYQFI